MKVLLLTWAFATILFILFDMVWFQISINTVYKPMFTKIQRKPWSVRGLSALSVWIMMGLFVALQLEYCPTQPRWLYFVYGFLIYGIYNMTNHAVFHDYNMKVALIDSVWGAILMGSVVAIILYSLFSHQNRIGLKFT